MTGGVVDRPGSLRENKTGTWRSFKPVVDQEKCIACGLCVQNCPEPCVEMSPKATIDYDYCKGCLICVSMCPVKAITVEEEGE